MNPELSGGDNDNTYNFEAQELILSGATSGEQPLYSVENYISHYNIDAGISGEKLTIEGIGREIGTNSKWVQREIGRFGIKPEMLAVPYASGPRPHFPAYVTELIREQHIWRKHYLSLPQRLTSVEITEEVGRSYNWTTRQLAKEGIQGAKARGQRFKTFPRIAVKRLREINFETPLDDGWYHIRSLETITGQDYAWIIRQLAKQGIEPQVRRSALTGMDGRYYPPEALELLDTLIAQRKEIPPAGDWLTLKAMQRDLGKSSFWIQNNMSPDDADAAKLMKDDNAATRTHYPPSTLEYLREALVAYETLPELGNWLTIPRIIRITGQERTWLQPRIDASGLEPELRRVTKANRAFPSYPPDIISFLQSAMNERKPKAPEGWYTAYGLSKLLNKSENWVNFRLPPHQNSASLFEDEAGVERIHYPQSVAEELLKELTDLEVYDAAEGWVTLKPLARRVGKHAVWVARVATELGITTELRLDKKGHPREHYSPESQQKLASYVLENFTYPKADGWFTFSDLFHYIGRSKPWIMKQLEELNEEGEIRLDGVNTPRLHYSPTVAKSIKEVSESLEPHGLVSVSQLAELTGRSKAIIARRLAKESIQGEYRFDRRGQLTLHYPPEVLNTLG